MKRKILSVLLACLMILSVIPMSVFADEAGTEHQHCPGVGEKHTLENCPHAEEIEVIPSQCGEYGYTLYQCPECEDYFAADFNRVDGNHAWEETSAAVEATCTTNGKEKVETCSNCGATRGGEIIPSEGHKYEETGRDGDCLTGGYVYEKCSVCGDEIKTAIEGTGKGHVWSESPVRIEKEPTWNEKGIAIYACTVDGCNAEKEVEIRAEHTCALEHNEGVEATCTEDGAIEYWRCTICNTLYSDENATQEIHAEDIVIDALGHDTENAVVKSEMPATCSQDGWKIVACNRCGVDVKITVESKGHSYENGKAVKVDPTCTAFGFTINACTVCGYVATVEKVDPLGHTAYDHKDSTDKKEVAADCENNGLRTWKCGRCGLEQKETLSKTGHEEVSVTVKATCSRYGYTFTYCSNENCPLEAVSVYEKNGVSYDVTVKGNPVHLLKCTVGTTLDPNNHNIKSGTINKPTCTEDGDEVGYCADCNEYMTKVLPKTGHNFDITKGATSVIKQAQSCTDDEIITVTCANCDATEDQHTDKKATGHDFSGAPTTIDPTCTKEGYDLYVCQHDGCGATTKKNIIPAYEYREEYTLEQAKKEHSGLSSDDTREIFRQGDCITVGLYKYSCSDCGKNVLVVIKGTGEGHVDPKTYEGENEFAGKAATCTEDGYTAQYTCSKCGTFVESEKIGALGHDWDKVDGKAATCLSAGYNAKWTCKRDGCGIVHDEYNGAEIAKLDHKWVTIPMVPATCDKAGVSEYRKCSECGTEEGKTTIPAIQHGDLSIADSRAVSCELYGYIHWLCPDCGYEYITGYKKALGHEWVLDEDASTAPGCESEGKNVYVCTNSDKCSKSEAIDPIGHKNAAGEELIDDCKNDVEDRICVNCDKEIGKSHNDTFDVKVPATCKDYGYTLTVCNNCGYNSVKDVDNTYLENHSWGEWGVTVQPTFTSEGEKQRICSVCKAKETDVVPAKTGMEYTLDIDNAVVSGAGYADSSEIAVKVSLKSAKVEVWGVMFDLVYDANVVTFDRAEFVSQNFITKPMANDNGGYVSVIASAANAADKTSQNVTVEGTEEFVVLYFRITNADATSATFSFDNCQALNKDGVDVNSVGETETIVIDKFLDVNADGDVNLADALVVYQMITGEIDTEYDVTVDVNRDGEVNTEDFVNLYEYLVGSKKYNNLVGRDA